MNVSGLRSLIVETMAAMPAHADELRQLDAALGDGDLGITVDSGSQAVREAVSGLPASADIQAVLLAVAKAFSTANPSTFAALVGGGLLAAAKTVSGKDALSRADAVEIGDAVAARIADRGKAQVGDKTILDALIPSLDALRTHAGNGVDALQAMVSVADERIEATAALQSSKGRAAWVQERSVGHPDPGATAYLRFLEELTAWWSR